MMRHRAFDQAQKRRPQSSGELRALSISATTSEQASPEAYALANAKIQLQAGRIAMYGVQLRERMATVRMVAARATQQPCDLIDELASIADETRKDLANAQKAPEQDFFDVAIAKQALKNLTSEPVSDTCDLATKVDALP